MELVKVQRRWREITSFLLNFLHFNSKIETRLTFRNGGFIERDFNCLSQSKAEMGGGRQSVRGLI